MCVQNQWAFLKVENFNGFKWSISAVGGLNQFCFIYFVCYKLQTNTSNSKGSQESHVSLVTTKSTIPASQMPKLSSDGMAPLDQEQQTNTEPSLTATANEQTSGNEERVRLQPSLQPQPSTLAAPLDSEQQSATGQIPESTDRQQQVSWPGESVAGPSDIGAQFVQAAEELVSLATSADMSQGEMRVCSLRLTC